MRADRSGDPFDGPVRELKGKIEQDAALSLRIRGGTGGAGNAGMGGWAQDRS